MIKEKGERTMKRIRSLDRFQKVILLILVLMLAVFTVAYAVTTSRHGYLYRMELFVPREADGATVYEGPDSSFTVTADTVAYTIAGKTYGPYLLRYDETAVPQDDVFAAYMTGIEILDGDTVYFRGAIFPGGDEWFLYGEDGKPALEILVGMGDGTMLDENGNIADPHEPSPRTIVELLLEPELTHKGNWMGWAMGLLVSVMTAVSILFIDELFRLRLFFQIQNPEGARPSDFHMAVRYIGWSVLPPLSLWIYCIGLQ